MNTAIKVVVVGSINMDLVIRTAHLPVPGETVLGDDYLTYPGGKGANQGVAAAKLGAQTTIIGAVGTDAFGAELVDNLTHHGVKTDAVIRKQNTASGIALIAVEEKTKENTIIVSGGANRRLTAQDISAAAAAIQNADILICQLEIPIEAVETALIIARQHAVITLLNAAPARQLSDSLLKLVDILVVNETEAMQLSEYGIDELEDIEQASAVLMGKGIGSIVITMGGKGANVVDTDHRIYVPAFPVKVIDTVGAGDAFAGAYAVAIARGSSLADALKYANAVGALATTKSGAQSGSPTAAEVETFLARFSNKDFV
ncbi:MAG: ribokinase [Anaerolineae bacterium]|jgi:ribokinase|nr:ribokinase [Anaerolineae bacterium]